MPTGDGQARESPVITTYRNAPDAASSSTFLLSFKVAMNTS